MTANELRFNILLGIDSLYEGTAPGYNDVQINAIINKAQRRVFKDKIKIFDTEESIKRMLSSQLKRGSVLKSDITACAEAAITNYPHRSSTLTSTFYSLPSSVARLVEETVILDSDLTGGETLLDPAVVYPITYDFFTKNYTNRYKKPSKDLVWRMDVKTEASSSKYVIELIYPTTYQIKDYIISYLKYPANIVVDTDTPGNQVGCEITDQQFQDEIISEAIKMIVAALNDEGYNIASAEKVFDE